MKLHFFCIATHPPCIAFYIHAFYCVLSFQHNFTVFLASNTTFLHRVITFIKFVETQFHCRSKTCCVLLGAKNNTIYDTSNVLIVYKMKTLSVE